MGDQRKLLLNRLGNNLYWDDLFFKQKNNLKYEFLKNIIYKELFSFIFILGFSSTYSFSFRFLLNTKSFYLFNSYFKQFLLKVNKKKGIYLSNIYVMSMTSLVYILFYVYVPIKKKTKRKKYPIFMNKLFYKGLISVTSGL